MKTMFTKLLAVVCLTTLSIGCGPKPVVVEEPAGEAVEIETVETEPEDDGAGVEVQVGGGEGVQVDVDSAE
jgi:hypothetical protein